jgi:hypothetical protein
MIRFQFQRFIEVGQRLGLAPALSTHCTATSIGVRQARVDRQSGAEIRNRTIVASPLSMHFTALKESIRGYGIEKRFWLRLRACFANSGSRPVAKPKPLMPLLEPMFLIIPHFRRKGSRRSSHQLTADSLGSPVVPLCKISPLVLSQRNTKITPPAQHSRKKPPWHRSTHGILRVHYIA